MYCLSQNFPRITYPNTGAKLTIGANFTKCISLVALETDYYFHKVNRLPVKITTITMISIIMP